MPLQLYVTGTAQIWSGTGAAGAMEELGVSTDGVRISINSQYTEVFTDHYGPKVPYDLQYFLQDAIIEADLVYFDRVVLNKWLFGAPLISLAGTSGQVGSAGSLVLQQNLAAALQIRATPVGAGVAGPVDSYTFHHCVLMDPDTFNMGVERQSHKMRWRALLTQQASGSQGSVLYDFTYT